MNLLQIVQQASGEMGLTPPTYLVGNSASDPIQMFSMMTAVGQELMNEFDWQALQKEYRFTTAYLNTTGNTTLGSQVITGIPSTATLNTNFMVSGTGINQDTYIQSVDNANQVTVTQALTSGGTGVALSFGQTKYNMPSDYDHQQDRTQYDKSKRWAMLGPESPQQWQFLKSSYIATGPRLRYRILGNQFQIWPMMSTPEYIGFEYVSNGWVTDISGNSKSSFTVDTDNCVFSDRLMVVGLKMRYFQVKGFDATEFKAEFGRLLSIAKAKDQGASTLSFAPQLSTVLVGWENIPDSGYGI
jgi:hypothetical protein